MVFVGTREVANLNNLFVNMYSKKRQAVRRTCMHTYRQTHRQTETEIHTERRRHTGRQTDTYQSMHTYIHIDRHTDRHTHTHINACTHTYMLLAKLSCGFDCVAYRNTLLCLKALQMYSYLKKLACDKNSFKM